MASLLAAACIGCAASSTPLPLPPEQTALADCHAGDVALGNWPFCCPGAPELAPGAPRVQVATAREGHHALSRLAASEGTSLRLAADQGGQAAVQVILYDERCVPVASAAGLHPGDLVPLSLRRARYYVVVTRSGGTGPVAISVDRRGETPEGEFPSFEPLRVASVPCGDPPPAGDTSWCARNQAFATGTALALVSCGDHRGSYFVPDGDACGIVIGVSVRTPADFTARVAAGRASGLMAFEEYDPATKCELVNADTVKMSVAGPGTVFLRAGQVRRLDMLDASPGSLTLAIVERPDPAVLPSLLPPGRAVIDGCAGPSDTPF